MSTPDSGRPARDRRPGAVGCSGPWRQPAKACVPGASSRRGGRRSPGGTGLRLGRCSSPPSTRRTCPTPATASPKPRSGRGISTLRSRLYERAFIGFRQRGETRRPALIAGRELSFLHAAVYGNSAASGGWLARARRLADEAGECPEAGWVELAEALATDDPDAIEAHARAATGIARQFGDTDLAFCALGYQGMGLVLRGRATDGMRRVDEAALAATNGEVQDHLVVGEIYCKMLLCCEMTLDVHRAQQWIAVADAAGRPPTICGCPPSAACTTAASSPRQAAGPRRRRNCRPPCSSTTQVCVRCDPGRRSDWPGSASGRAGTPRRHNCWPATSPTGRRSSHWHACAALRGRTSWRPPCCAARSRPGGRRCSMRPRWRCWPS